MSAPLRLELSVVIPLYNEEESLPPLVEQVLSAVRPLGRPFELVLVDDGSTDRTAQVLTGLAARVPELVAVLLRRNYGQTAAMAAGFDASTGVMIVTLDGDLQNDPADIPLLLERLEDGYDLVSGWRHLRKDAAVQRLLPSLIANRLIARVTGVRLHDYGCSLKAYRREVVADMNLYGELHRFLPALAFIEGARIAEVKVNHHPRRFGSSKYGIDRTFRVLMDLLTVWFMKRFLTRPMHVFGFGGLASLAVGLLISLYLLGEKVFLDADIGNRPLLLVAVLAIVAGIQLFCFGLLAELQMRTYHESQGRPIYRVRQTLKGPRGAELAAAVGPA
ncbi:glycosyltransferase family 2 protein [Synechococcus sp. MW101C3]|uniref:glycosyltransferase family 2 protein n=1 Tax=Synechococcus sp. MW101C3 TaxID=210768 RepID=UPI000B988658|nr:glycosyltransferase family 2 protein [Synechococcus sp. MW101C3]